MAVLLCGMLPSIMALSSRTMALHPSRMAVLPFMAAANSFQRVPLRMAVLSRDMDNFGGGR
eukprot:3540711-Rhodomonas_salina.2